MNEWMNELKYGSSYVKNEILFQLIKSHKFVKPQLFNLMKCFHT